MKGLVIKVISEFCYVKCEDDNVYPCKIKGIFRYENNKVITGDNVNFSPAKEQEQYGIIDKILKRKNELLRPRIANISQVVIISSVKAPNLDTYTLNKYLTFVKSINMKVIIAFTKVDLIKKNAPEFSIIKEYKKIGYNVFEINNIQFDSKRWESFEKKLDKKISVFTGQTGAGKSTTLNNLIPEVFQKTQEISKSLGRGKHTTTVNELFNYRNGFIADTPGFSSFEMKNFTEEDLAHFYLNFSNYNCKFSSCKHNVENEKICEVYKAYKSGEIYEGFYFNYIKLLSEIENKNRKVQEKWKK